MSVQGLAKKYGIHRATVSAHLSRRSTPRRRPGLDVEERAEAARQFRAGETMRAISRRLGVGRKSVRVCLAEARLIEHEQADPESSEGAGSSPELMTAS